MKIDIVRELINRLLTAAGREGSLTESVALEVEKRFRQEFSGESFYIKRRSLEEEEGKRIAVVKAYLESSASPSEIAEENGVSRKTMYRYLKR